MISIVICNKENRGRKLMSATKSGSINVAIISWESGEDNELKFGNCLKDY